MYKVDLGARDILRIEVTAFLSRAAAEAMFGEVRAIVPAARRRNGGRLLSIGVASVMPVQMALALDYLAKIAKLVFAEPDDRAGLVMHSTLVRLQMKRILPWNQLRVFTTESEALAWLRSLGPHEPRS